MSGGAGPSAPNPGAPKQSGPKPPVTRRLGRFGPQIALGVTAVGFAYAFYSTRAPAPPGTPASNALRTQGVKNIEAAYSNGGGTSTYQPAYGGTKQGDKDMQSLREGGASGRKDGFKDEGLGDEQRSNTLTPIGRTWNDMKYGSESGK